MATEESFPFRLRGVQNVPSRDSPAPGSHDPSSANSAGPEQSIESKEGTTFLFRKAVEEHDQQALDCLVRRMEPMLFAQVATKMGARLRSMFEVGDMTQSVILSFIDDLRRQKFEWRGSASLRANLIHRVINKIRRRSRDQSAKKRSPGSLVSLQDSAIADHFQPRCEDTPWLEEEEELQSAITELLAHYRGKESIVKFIWLSISGHSSAEIEKQLGVTGRRVKQIEQELRDHVRERWNDL